MRIDRSEDPLTEKVIGAAMEVHSILGPGFLEYQYEEALAQELRLRKIPFERQREVVVTYKQSPIGQYRLDFLIDKRLIVELKAVECFNATHTAQVIAYLAATGLTVGLLINFNVPSLKNGIKRVLFDK